MTSFVRRVVRVSDEGAETVFSTKKKKAKVSRWAKPILNMQRKTLKALETFARVAQKEQQKSNRKRQNGFLRDARVIGMTASQKAAKELTKGM